MRATASTTAVHSLGYLRLRTPDPARYAAFLVDIVGMMVVVDDGARRFRIDGHPYRFELVAGDRDVDAIGMEVVDDRALAELVARARAAGHDVQVVGDPEAEDHRVNGLARLVDPSGIRYELFHGPILDHVPLATPLVSGFVTGDQGLGHLVVGAPDLAASSDLARDVLGFRLRNTMRFPAPGAVDPSARTPLHFFGCNPRHHTLGLVGLDHPGRIVHFMVEVETIDDVGAALDRVHDAGVPISLTLGRHTNDRMVSFYCSGPDGYSIEIGCGGLRVGDESPVTTYEITKGSVWGHRRPAPTGR